MIIRSRYLERKIVVHIIKVTVQFYITAHRLIAALITLITLILVSSVLLRLPTTHLLVTATTAAAV